MIGSIGSSRAAVAALAAAAAFGLAACGDDGAGAGGSNDGATQNPAPPGAGTGTESVAITVSGAIPASGNAIVTGSVARAVVLVGTTRRMTADGSGGGLAHRVIVDYDAVTGVVGSVSHGWGASTAAFEAATQCVRTATAAGQALCGNGVAVDVVAGRVTFTNLVLRGAGSFTSILNGQIGFAAP